MGNQAELDDETQLVREMLIDEDLLSPVRRISIVAIPNAFSAWQW